MSERCCWPAHESFDRHESLAELGQGTERSGYRSFALVGAWSSQHSGPGHHGIAAASGYVILTNDLDFGIALAIANTEKPSVVQIRSEDLRPASIANQVLIALRQMQLELEEGALLTNASGWRRRTARSTRRLATAD